MTVGQEQIKSDDKKKSIVRRMKEIELLAFDFDGVMTDNRVLVDQNGVEAVWVNRADGLGVSIIKDLGIKTIILSTEENPVVTARANKLKVEVIQGIRNKKEILQNYCEKKHIPLKHVAYVGNDINDLTVMEIVGLRIVPSDAYEEVKKDADIILQTQGGGGVVRELAGMFCQIY